MTTIALGLATVLDTVTARQLHDYGDLDDAGIAAALEQAGLQRGRSSRWPGHLSRVAHVAVIVDASDNLTLAAFAAETADHERACLESLFAVLPNTVAGRSVAWRASDWTVLAQRAYRHELCAPQPVHAWPRSQLCELFDSGPGAPDDGARADAIRLYGHDMAGLTDASPALASALHWYVMDLRWRSVTGDIAPDTAQQRAVRAMGRAAQAADG